jgi:hypothetical protein
MALDKNDDSAFYRDRLPSRYVGPYKGKLIEHHVDKGTAWRVCGRGNTGCAFVGKGRCVIYYTDMVIRAHEIAHCNGWSGKHELEGLDSFHFTRPPPR